MDYIRTQHLTTNSCCQLVRVLSLALFLLVTHNARAFNIDIKNVKSFKGKEGSHFGYTLAFDGNAFLKEDVTRLYAGAPKETTRVNGIQTGAVHSCQFNSNIFACAITPSYHFPSFFKDPKSTIGEGYGSSLSVSDTGNVLVGAPYWKDTAQAVKYDHTYIPGRCVYQTDQKSSSSEPVAPFYHSRDKSMYLNSTEYYHGLALFGFSSDFTKGSIFAVGSPGMTIFKGAVYIEDKKKSLRTSTDGGFEDTEKTGSSYGYLGYEIKIGKFCEPNICLAAGAPMLKTVGMVQLYRWYKRKDRLYNYQQLQGEQAWSYFGSVLCAFDADNDGVDELLVGAPYYSESNRDRFDEGKVYVYKQDTLIGQYELHQSLQGNRNRYSRFGSAIQSIGDINLDKYPDVAIGAPGEEDGSGCIYIYLGGVDGLSSQYSQRICAKELTVRGSPLKRFGSTISDPISQKGTKYPAFAVSSYLSDTVAVFTTRVIVQANASIDVQPNPINGSKACHYRHIHPSPLACPQVTICFNQAMIGYDTRALHFIAQVDVDAQRRSGIQPRIKIEDPARQFRNNRLQLNLGDTEICVVYAAVPNEAEVMKDRFTPIEVKVTMRLDESRPVSGLDPVLDPTISNVFTYMISLANECGSDNTCNVDLSVQGAITYSHNEDWPYVVIGHTQEILVDLTITNNGETSYGTTITTELGQPLQYLSFKSDVVKQCKPDFGGNGVSTKTTVVCKYYQPLRKGSSIQISIVFDALDVAMDKKSIDVVAKAMPTDIINNPELTPKDNTIKMRTSVYLVADVNIHGTSSPAEVTVKNSKKLSLTDKEDVTKRFIQSADGIDTLKLNHKYQMKNLGPSFLPKTKMYLSIPVYLADASRLITKVSVMISEGEYVTECTDFSSGLVRPKEMTTPSGISTKSPSGGGDGGTDVETTTEWRPGGGVHKRKKRASDEEDLSDTYFLTCDTYPEYCITFKCFFRSDISSGGHVELNVTVSVDKENIPIPEGFSSSRLQLLSSVEPPTHLLFKPWTETAETTTSTVFHAIESGGEVNIWIIIGSVIGGLVLIVIIALIFWKLGFFKRNKHREEVKEWRRKSARMSMRGRPTPGQRGDDIPSDQI